MIERKGENVILDEAKNVDDAIVSTRLFNEIQDEIFHLQPIDEFLNNFNKKNEKIQTMRNEIPPINLVSY